MTTVDDDPLAFFPSSILSLGAPKPWLLEMLSAVDLQDTTQLYLADIGISNIAWKRVGNRRNRGIDFGNDWVLKLRYQGSVE